MSPRARRTSTAQHHVEWLQLVDVSGPFLSLGVLAEVFPLGLDVVEPELAERLKQAYAEWQANRDERRPDAAIDSAFVDFVLRDVLEYSDELIATGAEIGDAYAAPLPEHRLTLRPERVVRRPGEPPKLLVTTYAPDVALTKPLDERGLHASPAERMRILLSRTGVRSGLVTNGGEWILVHVPAERTATFVTWYANLLVEERVTLRALRSLVGVRRLFGVDDPETLDGLFERSRDDEREVTDQLGYQARHAVELLVAAFDRADRESGGQVTEGIRQLERNEEAPSTLYESVVALAMRIIFLLAAEARGLFPDDGPWAESYAVTPLRAELEAQADRHGIEVLERRFDAWPRLLATFRAVHGGVEHGRVRMPGYGGGLFDPKRYPFLAGAGGAVPRISNRTVLHVLDALQTLDVDVPGGRERRPLSFRALGIEQIGHVYEGLLDHTALRADAPALGLVGTKKKEPELSLAMLEEARARAEDALVELLKEHTGRSPSALRKALAAEQSPDRVARLRVSCGHDAALVERALPFLGLVRDDVFDDPVVFRAGDVFVTVSPYRRSTGTHYTPPSLTEPIVQYALEPVVYRGPAEGVDREQWELKRPTELLELKVCDIAMGSAAFLVAACRYLAARLVEAWELHPDEAPADAGADLEERELTARRLVAERCLYGVDVNPLAVEIAKVSLWLTTLRRDRPFTFVDHALRCGDSLLGLTSIEQLEALALRPEEASSVLLDPAREAIRQTLGEVREIRERIEATDAVDLRETEQKSTALIGAERKLHALKLVADLVVGAALEEAAGGAKAATVAEAAADDICAALVAADGDRRDVLLSPVEARAGDALMAGRAPGAADPPQPFHWVLEFPEVLGRHSCFDAIVGNPPFLGGVMIAAQLGVAMERHLKIQVPESKGFVDLVVYFHRRANILAGSAGTIFLFGPQTLVSTANRRAALDPLPEQGRRIIWGLRRLVWPGEASVEVCVVGVSSRSSEMQPVLDGEKVTSISAGLESAFDVSGAQRLQTQFRYSEGTHLYGLAFVKSRSEWRAFIDREPEIEPYLRPYVNAEILCSSPTLTGDRIAVDFGERDKHELRKVSHLVAHLEEHVTRERAAQTRQIHERRPWLFWDKRTEAYAQARELPRIIACPNLSKHLPFVFADPEWLFAKTVKFYVTDQYSDYAVLQSSWFYSWAVATSPLRGNGIAFSTRNSLDTFAFPGSNPNATNAGRALWEACAAAMRERGTGVTTLLNHVHTESESSSDILQLRALQEAADRAVADAYGWTDLELDHDFRETPLGLRYTVSEAVKTEALDRLLELNHARHAEEVAQGLHAKGAKRGSKSGRKKDASATERLFES